MCQGTKAKVRVEMTLEMSGTRSGEDHKVPHLHCPQEEGEEDMTLPQMMMMTTTGIVKSAEMCMQSNHLQTDRLTHKPPKSTPLSKQCKWVSTTTQSLGE